MSTLSEWGSFVFHLVVAGIDWILSIDTHLREMVSDYGQGVYFILFAIIFCETGLVIMPFLPGDSLLFAAGALSGDGLINVWTLYTSLLVAAIIGDALNYTVGRHAADWVLKRFGGRVIKQQHMDHANAFFEKWGSWAIVLARFAPFLRTFVPFVAGAAKMPYRQFAIFNVLGGFLWVTSFVWMGHFFGRLPFFQNNLKALILGIIAVSMLPVFIGAFRAFLNRKKMTEQPQKNH